MFLRARPAAPLEPFIRYYAHLKAEISEKTLVRPVPARTAPALEFTFGNPYEIRNQDRAGMEITYPATVIGAKTWHRVDLSLHGDVETFVIVFRGCGLTRLFSVPGPEIVNEHFDARSVFGRPMDDLRGWLGATDSFRERARLADEFLLERIPAATTDPIGTAAREILSKYGSVRIARLAEQTGLGMRTFERRFTKELGIAPKMYARIARFEAALEHRERSPQCTWTEVAQQLGYYDHMHMVHDFHQLSGHSPTELSNELAIFRETLVER